MSRRMNNDETADSVPSVAAIWSEDFNRPVVDFAQSEMFARLFKDGMALVEETAAYLDGPGREATRKMKRKVALAYAGESMRLTTRLMQVSSWLLVQRAIKEGEMSPEEAAQSKYRLSAQDICQGPSTESAEFLPDRLIDLLETSAKLYDRVERLDFSMFRAPTGSKRSAVSAQLSQLEEVFGGGRAIGLI